MAEAIKHELFGARHLVGWALFSASAGFVNAGALAACNSFVTHITGSVTSVAVDPALAGELGLVVALFILGGMVSVLCAEMMRSRPRLAFALPVIASLGLLGAIALAGKVGVFGAFGEGGDELGLSRPAFAMLGLLAMSMGMVNATIAVATDNQIRIAHLTGPATDLAGNLVRGALGTGAGHRAELRWAAIRLGKLVSFATGAAIAANIAELLRYDVFTAGALLLGVALVVAGGPEDTCAGEALDARDSRDAREP